MEKMVEDEIHVVTRALSSVGLDVDSVERVTGKVEPVFRAETNGGLRYTKILRDWNGAELAKVAEGFAEIGLPSARLAQVERYVLVMDPAPGWPLSTTLPVYFLPLSWWVANHRGLLDAMRHIGARLGRLHALTREGPRAPREDECRSSNLLRLEDTVRQRLGGGLRQRIEWHLEEVGGRRLPGCKTHGDPTPHNLFWNPRTGAIAVIDFNLHSSVALEDVAIFEAGLELMTGRLPHARRHQFAQLVDAFRAGYCDTGLHDHLPTDALRALKLGYYCKYLEKLLSGVAPNGLAEQITHVTDPPVIERRIRSIASTSRNIDESNM